jgi:hypothetical protein
VLSVVIVGDLIPDSLLGGVIADMKEGDVRFGVGWGAQSGYARRKERELGEFHGLPPEGHGLARFFCPRCELNLSRLWATVKATDRK